MMVLKAVSKDIEKENKKMESVVLEARSYNKIITREVGVWRQQQQQANI